MNRRKLLIVLILILSSFNVLSQTQQDSTALANKDIKSLLAAFDEWKYLKPENRLLNDRVVLLQKKINVKDSIIDTLNYVNDLNGKVILEYAKSEKNLIDQRMNLENEISLLSRKLKRQKKKTFLTSLVGGIGIIATGILILK